MKARLATAWFWIRSSFWFVPVLMTAAAAALAAGLVAFDRMGMWPEELPDWVYSGGAEGARSLLSAVAGSMITVAGVVFSITMVALSLASSQFGPRLLINFMRDSANQAVLGTFVATFMYCLMVLREIRAGEDEFVPHLSVTVAMLLTAASLIVLIYFIHHASTSIHVETVLAAVRRDLNDAVERFFGAGALRNDQAPDSPDDGLPPGFAADAGAIAAPASGYVQGIDVLGVRDVAARHRVLIRLLRRPGHFVVAGDTIAEVWPRARLVGVIEQEITHLILTGAMRTPTQDVEFAINELVEVAVRALSPGINDPFTAIACVDWLTDALCSIIVRSRPPSVHRDAEGTARVWLDPITFSGLVDAAFNQIRQHAHASAAVLIRLLEGIARIAIRACAAEDRATLLRHAAMVHRAGAQLPEQLDQAAVSDRFREVVAAVDIAAQRHGDASGQP